jgi:hypothetical protein
MGNTYKRYPTRCHRRPKGRRQAIINNCRPGSIPPDAWEDLPVCRLAWLPLRIAHSLYDDGVSKEKVREILKNKFKLKNFEIKNILEWL